MSVSSIAQTEPDVEGVRIALPRAELEPIFGPLRRTRSWHRLKERISKFNRIGRAFGVTLYAERESASILIRSKRLDDLGRFSRRLESARGHVQRGIAALVQRRLSGFGRPSAIEEFRRRQKAWSAAMGANPLQSFLGISNVMESVFLNPPFRVEPRAARSRTALETLCVHARDPKGKSLVILGPPGIGKTRLLLRTFRDIEPESGGPRRVIPVLLPASRIRFREGGGVIDWESIPGAAEGLGEVLDAFFRDGKLTLFFDGLDENPRLLDTDNPAVWAFWGMASRNRCFITCRTKYYRKQFMGSPIDRIFNSGLAAMHLPDWSYAHVKALYSRIAASSREDGGKASLRVVEHLAGLSSQALERKMRAMHLTALSVWAYAIFFASHDGGKFPRNEYEILDYLMDLLVRWERGRNPGCPPPDIAHGLICRLSWRAYRNGIQGDGLKVASEDVLRILQRHYPFLVESKGSLFSSLSQMPILTYDGYGGAFDIDRVFGWFLAAKHWLGFRDNYEGLREACETPLTYEITDFIFQGLDGLDSAAKRRFYETGKRAFDAAHETFQEKPDPRHVTAMQGLLQPLARAAPEEAKDFLQAVLRTADGFPELVVLSCARALAYLGDHQAVGVYLRRLQGGSRAREINRNFYLYWLKDGRPARQGLDWLTGLRVDRWDRTCGWFLEALSSTKPAALLPIHLFTFCDLVGTFGPAKARPDELRRAERLVERQAKGASSVLRRQAARFRKVLRAFPH